MRHRTCAALCALLLLCSTARADREDVLAYVLGPLTVTVDFEVAKTGERRRFDEVLELTLTRDFVFLSLADKDVVIPRDRIVTLEWARSVGRSVATPESLRADLEEMIRLVEAGEFRSWVLRFFDPRQVREEFDEPHELRDEMKGFQEDTKKILKDLRELLGGTPTIEGTVASFVTAEGKTHKLRLQLVEGRWRIRGK